MKRLICIMVIAGLYAGCSPPHRDLTPMTGKLDAAVNAHDVDAAMNFMANDVTASDPMGETHTGKDTVRAWFKGMMPGFHVESWGVHQSGDTLRWWSRASSDAFAQSGVNTLEVQTMAVFAGDKITYFQSRMTPETKNKMTFARFFEEVVAKKDVDAIDDFVSDQFVEHQVLPPGTPTGREGVKQYFKMMEEAFPDLKVTPIMYLADGDKVLAFTKWEGTNTGKFMGKPATRRKVSYNVMDVVTIADGKATEHWGVGDDATMMQQLAGK
jgi:predicted ester cyclase